MYLAKAEEKTHQSIDIKVENRKRKTKERRKSREANGCQLASAYKVVGFDL